MRASNLPRPILHRILSLFSAIALVCYGLSVPPRAAGGGPLVVGGTFGRSGEAFTWDTSAPILYRTDGGMLGTLTNPAANALVQQMFQVWQDVPTSNIAYSRIGQIQISGVGVDVTTATDFNRVACPPSGPEAGQNPIVYDADGSLFTALGFPSAVIGFAGPGLLRSDGRITCALAALNGRFLLGSPPPLTQDEFAAVFIHEFGHFSGLDHSQINTNCQTNPPTCGPTSEDVFGLPTMYPFLLRVSEPGGVPAQKTLAVDDIAWISRLYPETLSAPPDRIPFNTTHGTISGTVVFTDGVTQAQGVNVIARSVASPRRIAASVVSGYLYTEDRGQSVMGRAGSRFGSRDPRLAGTFDISVPAGDYTLEVESIRPGFTGGSGVGPLRTPIPMPGTAPPPAGPFTVTAGSDVSGVTITLLNTPSRFDAFESAQLSLPEPLPLWFRKDAPLLAEREAA